MRGNHPLFGGLDDIAVGVRAQVAVSRIGRGEHQRHRADIAPLSEAPAWIERGAILDIRQVDAQWHSRMACECDPGQCRQRRSTCRCRKRHDLRGRIP